jgi:hypothetical protein
MDMRAIAKAYLDAGYEIVPLLPGTKKIIDDGWQNKVYGLDSVRPDSNLGTKCLTPVVDIDDTKLLECTGGRRSVADEFLPDTGRIDGRPGKPRSHRSYVADLKAEDFKDLDDTMLVQILAGRGKQAVVPPSLWTLNGHQERRAWADGSLIGPPAAVVDPTFLRSRVVTIAAVALIARHWPTHGRRKLCLALSRFFLETLGLSDEVARRMLEHAATLGGSTDDGVNAIRGKVRDTKDALAKNEKAIGATYIRTTLPEGVALLQRLREWFGKTSEIDEAIERLNDRFAIVSVGNKVVVMDNLADGSIKKLWPFDEFKKLLSKERITIESTTPTGRPTTKVVPLASVWIVHPAGRRHESLVYDMPGSAERCGPDDYNGYLGFTVTPKAGDWSKNRDHALTIICNGDASLYAWLFNWMAALVQFPGRHAFTAVVLRGGQGIGKGHFAHLMLGALFHAQQYLHIIGAGMLTGQFNEHLSGKVLIFADESTWGGDPHAADKLKGMVTESTVPIERKFLPLVEEPSAMHIVIASNNEWPVSIPRDDRRFYVLDVSETQRQMESYFTPLRDELRNGGLAAMLFDLLKHDVDDIALRHPPTTKGKREVMTQSLKPIERWWYEKLVKGTMSFTKIVNNETITVDGWPTSIMKATLHEDYLLFLDKHRETRTRRSTETELGMFLKKYAPVHTQRLLDGTQRDEKQHYGWTLPTLLECRRHWADACGWDGWDDDDG